MPTGFRSSTLPHSELTEQIIRGFHDVVHELGCGFSEKVQQRALAIVLEDRGLRVETGLGLTVEFRSKLIGTFYPDLIVDRTILIEVKATTSIDDSAVAQILNYLKAAGGGVGLLLNFGRKPECKRFVVGDPANSLPRLRSDARITPP